MKNTKRMLMVLVAMVLAQALLPMTALAAVLKDNPAGTTLAEIGPDDTMTNNYGTVTNNRGIVMNNYGTVSENNNTVSYNYGTVTNNPQSVTENNGLVTENNGTVFSNFGTITTNNMSVWSNYGTITNKSHGTVGTQYYLVTRAGAASGARIENLALEKGKEYIQENIGTGTVVSALGYRFRSAPVAMNATVEKVSDAEYTLKNATGPVTLTLDMQPVIVITGQPQDAAFTFGNVSGELITIAGAGGGSVQTDFQWYACDDKGGRNATPISGATEYFYQLPADLARGKHYYFCHISAPGTDDADTDVAEVTVSPLIADPNHCKITGITSGQAFAVGDIIPFEAVGAGMNYAPGEGDTRHAPFSWSMNPSGSWTQAPYTAAIDTAQLAPGAHTLTVTFGEQRYESGRWVNTGHTTTKSVGITLKAGPVLPPETGDDSSTGLWLALMGLACAGIMAMLAYRHRNKKANEK